MKRMIQLFLPLLMLSLFSLNLAAQNEAGIQQYAGNWSFTVQDAPYGYEGGTAVLKVIEGKLTGEFKLGEQTLKVNEFKSTETGYSTQITVDGYPVDIRLTFKDSKLQGTAEVDNMNMPISFIKAKK